MNNTPNKAYPLNVCQLFLAERLCEIFHKSTLDSYRVRTHNAHTLVKELVSLINQWINGNIKQFETLELCASETKAKIETDTVYLSDYPHKDVLTDYLDSFIKYGKNKPSLCERISHLLEEILTETDSQKYISNLLSEIKELTVLLPNPNVGEDVLMDNLHTLDSIITSLSSELIHVGFSNNYLYTCAKKINIANFSESFDKFVELIDLQNKKDYIIIFKLSISGPEQEVDLPEIFKSFPDEYKTERVVQKTPNFITSHKKQGYFSAAVQSYDEFSAIKQAKEKLSNHLDRIHFALHDTKITSSNSALVLEKRRNSFYVSTLSTLPVLDGIQATEQARINLIQDRLNAIHTSDNIATNVTNRINSALRHLRIGDADAEIEQRFINYWIALEFLFSTPIASDSTFGRVKDNLANILVSCYGKRNLIVLDSQIKSAASDINFPHVWEAGATSHIKANAELPILLEYRLYRYSKHILSDRGKEIRKYLELHKQNITWQIARIYRLRNELIHEAAIRQDIESLASNLRYYLIFVLNQAVRFFSKRIGCMSPRLYNMESFFMHYDFLRASIEKNPSISCVMEYGDFDEDN